MDIDAIEQAMIALADELEGCGDSRSVELRQMVGRRPEVDDDNHGYRHRYIAVGDYWIVERLERFGWFGRKTRYAVSKEWTKSRYRPLKFDTADDALNYIRNITGRLAADLRDDQILRGEL